METPLNNVDKCHGAGERVAVLAVSPNRNDLRTLRNIFGHTRWRLHEAGDREQAEGFFASNRVGVLICDSELPDGRWTNLLESIPRSGGSPLLVVCAEDAEKSLWAEALNLGAYDVLSKPFDKVEVIRIVSLAWLQWRQRIKRCEAEEDSSTGERRSARSTLRPVAA